MFSRLEPVAEGIQSCSESYDFFFYFFPALDQFFVWFFLRYDIKKRIKHPSVGMLVGATLYFKPVLTHLRQSLHHSNIQVLPGL